ncbi:MAG: type VI secretion system tip protein VgrG [Myxococcales bacterium]|nr:type VI secretion system tip protein VgrG [Myxococcales bacterium]
MATERTFEHVTFQIDGQSHEVVSLAGEEGLSTLFRFEVECAGGPVPADPAALLGAPAAITLHDGRGTARTVHGIVAEASARGQDDGHSALVVVVRPAAYKLTLGRDSRPFQASDVVAIVTEVVAAASCPTRWETNASYPKRAYTVQYREDDWSFVSRLLEEEGIYYWFDHQGGASTLVFGDTSIAAPDLPGGAHIRFAKESGLHADAELIEELGTTTQVTSGKFTVGSFDPHKPLLKVTATTGQGPFEIYRAPGGGPESPSVCAARARTLSEMAGTARSSVAGLTSSVRVVPGMALEVTDHPTERLDRKYLVTSASYRVVQRRRAGAGDGPPYACRFTAIPHATPYRAPEVTPRAAQPGAQSGVVVGMPGMEIHTDALARVRVQQHWDRVGTRDHTSGKWMRVAQRGSAESMLFPRIGWTVLTFNEEGAVDAPSVFNRIPDAEHPPPYPLPAGKTRLVIKTATTPGGGSHNEIRFEDLKGAEEMLLQASRDMNVLVKNLKTEFVERDQSRVVGQSQFVTVGNRMLETVRNDQTIAIGAKETITAKSGAARTVNLNETETVGGSRTLKVGGSHTLSAAKTRSLAVGTALLDVTLGNVSATAGLATTLVGGAALKLSGASIAEDAGQAALQLVGGAKLELAKKSRNTDVKQGLTETVGGVMSLDTADAYVDNAETRWELTAGASIRAEAPSVWIEAKDKIELSCGASVVTIRPDSVEIKAAKFDLSSCPEMVLDTKLVEHN